MNETLATPDAIRINDTVSYVRPGYRIDNALILNFGADNRALVLWLDEFGQQREMLVGVEFLRKKETPQSADTGRFTAADALKAEVKS